MKQPTLMEVRQAHDLTSHSLAEAAGVPFSTEYTLEIGGMVPQHDAEHVLHALSSLTGKVYTLEQFEVITCESYLQAVVPMIPVIPHERQ